MFNRGRSFHRRGGSSRDEGGNYGRHGNYRGGWRGSNRGNFRGRSNYNNSIRGDGYRGSSNVPLVNFTNDSRADRMERDDGKPGKRLSENEIGITQYISKCDGFSGIIKLRYSDFQVSEINLNGEVAKLTDLTVPENKYIDNSDVNDEEDEELLILNKFNVEILAIDIWDKINALAISNEKLSDKIEIDATEMTKEERTIIHDSVKKVFGSKIIGSTVTTGDKKLIVFTKYFKGVRVDKREKWRWPGEYVHFIVYKENCDTMEAASLIAASLHMNHIKPTFFGYAGTKDRRAKTSQWFCIKKVDPYKIMNGCKQLRNITVGNYTFKDTHLKLGDLKGNRFRIALRNVVGSDELINQSMESLRDNGFINYYGLQRFGSRADIPTYKIGIALLQGNFQEAIDLILEPRGPFARQLRKYRETRDVHRSMFGIPRNRQSIEIKLLQGLANCNKNDLISALERIPRNTRLLYIHSYQSWVWNRCVSERLKLYGFTCQVGDLIPLYASDSPEDLTDVSECFQDWDENINTEDSSKDEPDQADPKPLNESKDTESKSKNKKKSQDEKPKLRVRALTKKDIEEETYSIFDVVLPLPGYDIEYPPNMKEYYEKLLQEDNLTLQLKQRVKCYSLCGTYRRICSKPENLSWKTLHYLDPHADLIASDLDDLNKKRDKKDSNKQPKEEPTEHLEGGKYKALLLEFTLNSSTYATMALREILKADTSCENQAQNNDYYKDKNDANESTNESATSIKTEELFEPNSSAEPAAGIAAETISSDLEVTMKLDNSINVEIVKEEDIRVEKRKMTDEENSSNKRNKIED